MTLTVAFAAFLGSLTGCVIMGILLSYFDAEE